MGFSLQWTALSGVRYALPRDVTLGSCRYLPLNKFVFPAFIASVVLSRIEVGSMRHTSRLSQLRFS
jgi:hypothetical protein